MAEVYFSKELDKILDKIDYSRLGKNVALKVHFGEKGCETYLSSDIVRKVYDKIISLGKKATLVECNALYRGSRTNSKDHIKTAIEHGFDFAPIDILDGELGDKFIEINIDDSIVKLGAGLKNYDSMIVLTHFKGHPITGFGGAIKNIGMGLGSRAGKLYMHSDIMPSVNISKCIACGRCFKNCNANAISINSKARINPDLCNGCAMCIAVCASGAIKIPWSGSNEEMQKKIINYARGVLKLIPNAIFINFLINITPECDCFNYVQKSIMEDIGVLYSDDIVAIDKASFDLVNKKSNEKFEKINTIDKSFQIEYAYSKGLGEKEYKFITDL